MKCPEYTNLYRQKVHYCLLVTEGKGRMESAANGYKLSFWDDEDVLEFGGSDDWTVL